VLTIATCVNACATQVECPQRARQESAGAATPVQERADEKSEQDALRESMTEQECKPSLQELVDLRLQVLVGTAGTQVLWLTLNAGSGTMACRKRVDIPEAGVGDMSVRQDGRIVAAGGWDARVRIFHMRTGKRLSVLKQHRASITAVAYDTAGVLACASRDRTISIWDLYRDV
jgi:hypothetical protein